MTRISILHLTIAIVLCFWFVIVYLLTMSRLVTDAHIERKYILRMIWNYTTIDDVSHVQNFQIPMPEFSVSAADRNKHDGPTAEANKSEPFFGYAVLSSDHHFEYLFTLPIVALSWRRLNIDSLILLIGTEEQYESDQRLKYVVDHLKSLNVRLFFLHSAMADSFTLAQVSRLFAAALHGLNLSDSTVLITADADMISFNLSNHFPDLQAGKKVFLYNSGCCGLMQRDGGKESYPQIPINTIAMTVELWREVMRIAPNSLTSGDQIVNRLNEEFGEEVVTGDGGKGSEKWYIDQNLVSSLLHQWIGERKSNQLLIDEKKHYWRRYDRIDWPFDFEEETLDDKDDAHLLHPLYGSFWYRTVGLLQLLFNSTELQWCEDYHDGFLKLACPHCFSRLPAFARIMFSSSFGALLLGI